MSLIVLTFNEAANLPACLASVENLVAETFVVDSGSTDGSRAIASAAGATVFEHPFTTHAEQWLWALSALPITSEWVLGLDADQRVTSDLAMELRSVFSSGPPAPFDGYYMKRRQIFRGRWIRHGGYYPKYLLKLFRRDHVRIDSNERLDHHFYVGNAGRLEHDIIEENLNEDAIGFWLSKHIRYADILSEEAVKDQESGPTKLLDSAKDPAQRSVALKAMFRRLPKYWRGIGLFSYRYFIRLGCLDGKEGFVFHFLQSCWFRIIVDIMIEEKLEQLERPVRR